MLFISSRKSLFDDDEIGRADEFWDLDVRRGMLFGQQQLGGIADIRNLIKGKKVLLLVHGYNNQLEDVIRAYDVIENNASKLMKDKYDFIIGYTWPGGDDRFDYFAAKTRAGAIAPRFSENLRDLHSAATRAKSLDVMTHSMGARVAYEGLKLLSSRNVVRNLMNMASAVDNESIEKGEEYFVANGRVRNSFVFHSRHDQVLNLAYRFAEFDSALGLHGPEDPGDILQNANHTFVVNCKRVIKGHGEYKAEESVYKYLNGQVDKPNGVQFSSL